MIAYFLLGITLLVAAVLLIRWFMSAEPKTVVVALKWTLAAVGIALALFLLLGGARYLSLFALPFLLPLLFRSAMLLRMLRRAQRAAKGPEPGQTSEVRTRFLRMTLDHDTGAMEGTVVEGDFRGHRLAEMAPEQLVELWRTCRAEDEQSAQVLEAYLDRMQADWREAAGAGASDRAEQEAAGRRGAGGGEMTKAEAYEILGLNKGASEAEIREAHRKLMQKLHPDHGGSNYLATKLNQAKEILLRSEG
ncbi:MAG: DnaJ domain-containing protein [Rhodovibrionaceae bacterium]